MQQLAIVDNPRLAQSFVDYMATLKIACQLSPHEHGVVIWLVDDAHLTQAQSEWQAFIKDPMARKYQQASWQVGDQHQVRFSYGSSSSLIKQRFLSHCGPFTLVMIAAAIIVYLASMFMGNSVYRALFFPTSMASFYAQPWRIITPILLHFSLTHILFNLLWWWEFGGAIERKLGSAKLIILTIVSGILPNFMQFWSTGPLFGGLSGVVYALLGYLWWTAWLRPHVGVQINRMIVGFMLLWMVLGFVTTPLSSSSNGFIPATANLAHLFGLIVGCAQAGFDRLIDKDIS
ncbi:rhomboid family intramembrane serine protease GlpG [Celerinatantimonas sp. MCCC 1A17872]|uniref:rhomboid family intramembrane serine protease GlpG n=1 Tax=Celerinatantimonas sp. MCCC 1A17872 TaxID=3177514 RepID=UPI0038CB6685